MLPGIPRATSGAMIGLLVGFAMVMMLRLMIGIEPYWHTGLGFTLGILLAAGGFIWGIGGFNPSMSQHADDSIPPPTADELVEQVGPWSVLGGTSWLMAFVAFVMMVVLIGAAYVPGLGLTVTSDPNSSAKSIGTVPMTLFGSEFMVSQAVLLILVIGFIVVSMAIAAAILAAVTIGLSGGIEQVKHVEKTGTGLPRGVEKSLANRAGQLAEAIAPKEDKDTTAVVAQNEKG